nr:AAA family ATPase [Quadrisphaera sp. RL12-1S]
MGLTGAQHRGSSSRPQGVLFFAGPTGVGKTELAKALAEVLFGADDACTRFDMSEFAAEHSEARLIGAPPGYVGFHAGGELTNAVRQKPFSVLLFDEVEKAHPRILDTFLQILEDGRLTDGSGSTVYFSECVIIFTSNLGAPQAAAVGPAPGPIGPAEVAAARTAVLTAVRRHFVEELQRPELLSRIGDNVVVFDAVSEQVAGVLVQRQARAVVDAVLQRRGVEVVLEAPVLAALEEQAVAHLGSGGRGVGAAVETVLVNPLARTLASAPRGGTLRVTAVRRGPEGWELQTAT